MNADRLPHVVRFQSTLSVRRATCSPYAFFACEQISIHALRKESDNTQSQDAGAA